jgi:hypothetical protein
VSTPQQDEIVDLKKPVVSALVQLESEGGYMVANGDDADVYEHGILVHPGESAPPFVRIATTRLPIYSGYTLTVVDHDESSLNERVAQLLVPPRPHTAADWWDEADVRYALGGLLYHLNQLVELYVQMCALFETTEHLRTSLHGNVSVPRVFYELDSLISCARRIYESIRKVLWKHYVGDAHGRWRSVKGALESPHIPHAFSQRLNDSWGSVGETLTAYRDCIAHYEPLTDGQTTCWMEPVAGRWGMTVRLPSNPRSGRRGFDFAAGPDAMVYSHQIACHLVSLVEALAHEPRIASRLRAGAASS